MAAAAEVRPKQILPRIAALVLPPPPRADAAAAGARAPGCAAAEDEAMRGAARRLKGAQALSQSVLRLGATLPPPRVNKIGSRGFQASARDSAHPHRPRFEGSRGLPSPPLTGASPPLIPSAPPAPPTCRPPHAGPVMHALLLGARDADELVRASCLACLAQVRSSPRRYDATSADDPPHSGAPSGSAPPPSPRSRLSLPSHKS